MWKNNFARCGVYDRRAIRIVEEFDERFPAALGITSSELMDKT